MHTEIKMKEGDSDKFVRMPRKHSKLNDSVLS